MLHLPSPCVVVLVGPGASGKSTWAAEHFAPPCVVSSDVLRGVVGGGEDDVTASADAFALLEQVVRMRIGRGLTTVIDTLGLDAERRRAWLGLAREHGLPCVAVAFDTPAAECRERNRNRPKRIPADVLGAQLRAFRQVADGLDAEGFDRVLRPEPVRVVPEAFVSAQTSAELQRERPAGLRFGLHIGSYTFSPATADTSGTPRRGSAGTAQALREIAVAAEGAGFDAIYVMDHFRQIPQVGRAWDDFLESYTTLAYLAACTTRVRLGTLVTGVTYRNVGHLAKIVATLDVLSGGRAVCGLGLAWFAEEHRAYGWPFPPVPRRYELLEDALRALPILWGPGGKPFRGAVLDLADTSCYPRPLQEHVPMILGGGGEKQTLALAARYADAANVMGDLPTVVHKRAVLDAHCAATGRSVELTHLSTALVGESDAHVSSLVEALRPRRQDPGRYAASVHAGTVADHIGRFRQLADAGVTEVMLRLPDLTTPAPLNHIAAVISAFR